MYVALIIKTDTPFSFDYADDWDNFRKEMQTGKIHGGSMCETKEQMEDWARNVGGVVLTKVPSVALAERQG